MERDLCERTFLFATRIVCLCRELDKSPGVSRTLCRQLLRAGTSIGANVEEAQAGQSRADFCLEDADRVQGRALCQARDQTRDLRGTRRGPALGGVLPRAGLGLCVVLAIPSAHCETGGGAGGVEGLRRALLDSRRIAHAKFLAPVSRGRSCAAPAGGRVRSGREVEGACPDRLS